LRIAHAAVTAPREQVWHDCLAGDKLDGALARDEVVMEDAADGEHSKAAVLDLRELKTAKKKKKLQG
jgi:hypothetical protein